MRMPTRASHPASGLRVKLPVNKRNCKQSTLVVTEAKTLDY